LVEIWGNVNMGVTPCTRTLLEKKALLLRTNGDIVDVNGNVPQFEKQNHPVRIIVKHRNHLAVMSNEITDFTVNTVYDFTTAETQAHKYSPVNPAPMTLKNGVYCMWAGDIMNASMKNDGLVNVSDVIFLQSQYLNNSSLRGTYFFSDINMDGQANTTDMVSVQSNFGKQLRSPLSYFTEN
jgi:hypothetical protein